LDSVTHTQHELDSPDLDSRSVAQGKLSPVPSVTVWDPVDAEWREWWDDK